MAEEIVDIAADWAVRLDDGPLGEDARAELLAWLKASPRHVEEFLRVSAMFEDVGFLDLVAEAIPEDGRKAGGSVVPLKSRSRPAPWRAVMAGALAACAAMAVGLVSFGVLGGGEPAVIERQVARTEIGESHTLTLSDGTRVTLNTASKAEFLLTETRRSASLAEGEAFFEVAKDAGRPFVILAGEAAVEVIGTAFSTRVSEDGTVLQVEEGLVRFGLRAGDVASLDELSETPFGGSHVLAVGAGQAADWRAGAPVPELYDIAPDRIATWREQRLVFDNLPIGDVVAEFNRYNRTQLHVEDAELSAQTISAEFSPTDLEGFVRFIEISRPEMQIVRTDGEIRISRAN